ncbi:hypothetical protein F5144DRAFT_596088 [Chaetomium tenue]|uniref:Uncharacterized protein n=1 Tax=Chaetomium tenue TaxID=1854479 RepID=A0ACB7NXN6_9PEZI|nr:hypothetical protein F5144DRAFT_596088 [Chaetomium globosum]
MAVEGATQALVAAFFFGIVLNAASAALVLYVKGHGLSAVFRDSQRLVLVLFLLSAGLWAQIDFITILLDISTSSMPCQIGIIFSTTFDQFARFSIEQFLLWALNNNNGTKLSLAQLIPQILVLVRFLAGAIFIGFTRPQTDDFCVATTSALPVGILVAALDGVIVFLLIIRAYSAGGAAKENRDGKGVDADRARALMTVLLGLVFWTGTSVPMLLGFQTLALATRTALPAGGLLVVIAFVASGAETLLTSRGTGSRPPEAPSPRRINISRDISTSSTDYPPTRFEDLKEAAIRSSRTFDETSVGVAHRTFHPIVQQNNGQNPWSKIAVVDLKEAAVADRERRARMHEEENATAMRPAWPSMDLAPEEALKRGVSLKRKEVASASIRESIFPGALQPEDAAVAVTSSAQLSPGGEETRRRSPRPSLQEESVQPRQASPVRAMESPEAESQSAQNLSLTRQQSLPKPNIRPSRMLPPSPTTPPAEPTKTPLQRRPTIGLPSNPRARGLAVAEEPGSQHRTILFVNNIEYNNPAMVEAIIKTAGHPVKQAPIAETPGTPRSVVNRPRPIPRKPSDSSAQSSPALNHRRTKSGGSLMARKSLLAPSPGSPTTLPPLPVLPRSATVGARPHPNNTKSMTFQERVTLMFPNPPSSNAVKRRSSLPDVPPIPVSYWDVDSSPSEPYDRQRSNRTTQASTRTESILEVDEIPRKAGKAMNTVGEAGSSWLRAFGDGDAGNLNNRARAKEAGVKRGSSPVIPEVPVRASAWTETTYDRSEDDGTNWSSMNTPEVAVGIPVMQRLGLPSSVRMPGRQNMRGSELSFADTRSRETLPIMLDTSSLQQPDRQGPMVTEAETVASPELPTWHRRVGDVCPTFSDREKKVRARKMPPPAPLPLHTLSTKKILAIQVEPSPLESPGQAIQQIQAQLRKLDELEQATPESASRRIALLEDLEREMGQQEEHWEEIKHDIGRDSLSSMQTLSPAGRNSRHASVASTINMAREVTRKSIGAERRASRLAHMQNNLKPSVPEPPVRNSVSPQLSKWQKRLTEAQMDYMDARLLRTSNVNFMQLSKAQLASPTPPDSNDSEVPPLPSFDEEVIIEMPSEARQELASLWTPAPEEPPRPVTQRPPRRNKRVTLLPDILESPQPLPDKRGTLGIFQFPWGEKSDTASVQPRPSMFMAMPGTMSSGTPSIGMAGRARQPESAEYSSSFFDDYDEEDEIMGMDSDEGEDSDDGFDETTLWEIASLLKTDEVPSRNSLLPPPHESVVDDYIDELSSDEEGQSIVIGLAEPLEVFVEQQRDSATLESSALLMLEDALEAKTAPKQAIRIGLPANPKASLNSRAAPAPQETPEPEMSRMACSTSEVQKPAFVQKQGLPGLWRPPSQADKFSASGGLFVFKARRSDGRGTSEAPAAMYISRKPRLVEQKPLERLASTNLWVSGDAGRKSERNWILGVRPTRGGSRLQRPRTTPEDWKAALSEAIAASYPRRKLNRTTTTPAEWEAALQKAISLAFNPAIRHPVFFGSLTITRPEQAIHPALPGYAPKELHQSPSNSRSRSQAQRKNEVHSSDNAPSPALTMLQPTIYHNSAIQAQIEALEQERMFAERTAQAEYRRRTSMAAVAEPVVPVEEEMTGFDTVQDLQRRLSLRIRQSLVFAPAPVQQPQPVPAPPVVAASVEVLRSEVKSKSAPRASAVGQGKTASYLWTSDSRPAVSTTGMWSAAVKRGSSASPSVEEDNFAALQRASRRGMLQKKQEEQEILEQMAAIERGENPFVHFSGMKPWVGEKVVVQDWLHSVCAPARTTRAVTKQLWASSRRSNSRALSRAGLWVPTEAIHPEPFTQAAKVPRGAGTWDKNTVSPPRTAKRDWLHSVCIPAPTSASATTHRVSKRLWAARRPSSTTSHPTSAVHLWPAAASLPWTEHTESRKHHRRHRRAEMWTRQQQRTSAAQLTTTHDWLHSVCTPTTPNNSRVTHKQPQQQQLWAALPTPLAAAASGLWYNLTTTTPPSASLVDSEDSFAAAARARRRKAMQEMMEMQEILARIAAIERGEDPFARVVVVVASGGMWSAGVSGSGSGRGRGMGGRDWLHSVEKVANSGINSHSDCGSGNYVAQCNSHEAAAKKGAEKRPHKRRAKPELDPEAGDAGCRASGSESSTATTVRRFLGFVVRLGWGLRVP